MHHPWTFLYIRQNFYAAVIWRGCQVRYFPRDNFLRGICLSGMQGLRDNGIGGCSDRPFWTALATAVGCHRGVAGLERLEGTTVDAGRHAKDVVDLFG